MIPFAKAHACGNDFLIVTEEAAAEQDWAELTRRLCARNTGIGADGVEFFAWTGPRSGRIRLHNADGSIAEISGNGTRCVAAWMARERNSHPGDNLEIATDAGTRVCHINGVNADGEFTVDVTTGMGSPAFATRKVKLASGAVIAGVEISTGNPHFVNVEFVRIVNQREIEIRIFERGVGPTTSSGTGSSASATAAIAFNGCISPLSVVAPGGAQTVAWDGPGTELRLTGPASLIARGEAW